MLEIQITKKYRNLGLYSKFFSLGGLKVPLTLQDSMKEFPVYTICSLAKFNNF